jgi:hypothetical protein
MSNVTHILEHGEYIIERYRVQITELLDSGWARNMPWLQTIITNRRFILIPEAEDDCSPIIISHTDIVEVWNVGLGRHDGIVISLKSGEMLHMLVDWNEGRRLLRDTRTMMTLRPDYSPRYML